MKQGGTTASMTQKSRPMPHNQKCRYCNRNYAMDWAKNNHENSCKAYNGIKD